MGALPTGELHVRALGSEVVIKRGGAGLTSAAHIGLAARST